MDDIVRSYFEATGSSKKVVPFPLPGKTAHAIRSGALTCPENRYGRTRREEFLHEEMKGTSIKSSTGEPGWNLGPSHGIAPRTLTRRRPMR
jgi:hypothetical protein